MCSLIKSRTSKLSLLWILVVLFNFVLNSEPVTKHFSKVRQTRSSKKVLTCLDFGIGEHKNSSSFLSSFLIQAMSFDSKVKSFGPRILSITIQSLSLLKSNFTPNFIKSTALNLKPSRAPPKEKLKV